MLKLRKVSGISLLEIIVAVALTTIIAGAVTAYLTGSLNLEQKGSINNRLNQEATVAIGWLERDIRETVYIQSATAYKLVLSKKNNETITYQYDSTGFKRTSSSNNTPETLIMNTGNMTDMRIVDIALSYRDQTGPIQFDTATGEIPQNKLQNIRLITFKLTTFYRDNSLYTTTSIRFQPGTLPVRNKRTLKQYPTITAAVTESDPALLQNGDTIQVKGGRTYAERCIIWNGLTLEGGYNTDWTARNQESIVDGLGPTPGISGTSGTFNLNGPYSYVIDGFTFNNGYYALLASNNFTSITVNNCKITNNQGAVHFTGNGQVFIRNSLIQNNNGPMLFYLYNLPKVGLYNCTINNNIATSLVFFGQVPIVEVFNCSITNNTAHPNGQVLYFEYDGDVTIANSLISNNVNQSNASGTNYNEKGVLFVWSDNLFHNTVITNSEITDNAIEGHPPTAGSEASEILGFYKSGVNFTNCSIRNNHILGGSNEISIIKFNSQRAVQISKCDINDNELTTSSASEAIVRIGYPDPQSAAADSILISRCNMRNNKISGASSSGILKLYQLRTQKKHRIENSLFALNTITSGGDCFQGIIYIDPVLANNSIDLANITMTDNNVSATSGNILFCGASTGTAYTLKNSIIYGNALQLNKKSIYFMSGGTPPFMTASYLGWVSGDCTNTPCGSSGTLTVTGSNINANPAFIDAANPTPSLRDYHLKTSSPCKDQGNPAAAFNDHCNGTAPYPPAVGTCRNDLGAYGGPLEDDVGYVKPTADDVSTSDIKEQYIGTYPYP